MRKFMQISVVLLTDASFLAPGPKRISSHCTSWIPAPTPKDGTIGLVSSTPLTTIGFVRTKLTGFSKNQACRTFVQTFQKNNILFQAL
jgi:hypothetical protein